MGKSANITLACNVRAVNINFFLANVVNKSSAQKATVNMVCDVFVSVFVYVCARVCAADDVSKHHKSFNNYFFFFCYSK